MPEFFLVDKWEILKGEALKVREVLDFWLMSKKRANTYFKFKCDTGSCEGQFCMTMTVL